MTNRSFEKYNQVRAEVSAQYLKDMRPVMEELVADGLSTYQIALQLMVNGYTTVRGKPFTAMNVWLLLEKLGLKTKWSAPDIGLTKLKSEAEVSANG